MKVDSELIRKIAKTARLDLSEKEIATFTPQLQEILNFFSEIEEANVSEQPSFLPVDLKNITREDIPRKCLSQEDSLRNTAHKKDGYFKGPKAI